MMWFPWRLSMLFCLTLLRTYVLGECNIDMINQDSERSVIDLQDLLGNVVFSLNEFREELDLMKMTVADKLIQIERQNISGLLLDFRKELTVVKQSVTDQLTKWEEHILPSSLYTIRQDVEENVSNELAKCGIKKLSSSLDEIRHGLIEIGKCVNQNPLLQQSLNGMTEKVITRLDKLESKVTAKIDNNGKESVRLRHCADVFDHFTQPTGDGVYMIHPQDLGQFEVYCDMTTDGGGWTVFQKRGDFLGVPANNFLRKWQEYKEGFGDLRNEFWLGLDKLSSMTKSGNYELRVDLAKTPFEKRYAKYLSFKVQNEQQGYRLSLGTYSGNAGESMFRNNGMMFSTLDRDNDGDHNRHCAQDFSGAWWYSNCHSACLNGLNLKGSHSSMGKGIEWNAWTGDYYSLLQTEMKFRPQGWKRKMS